MVADGLAKMEQHLAQRVEEQVVALTAREAVSKPRGRATAPRRRGAGERKGHTLARYVLAK